MADYGSGLLAGFLRVRRRGGSYQGVLEERPLTRCATADDHVG